MGQTRWSLRIMFGLVLMLTSSEAEGKRRALLIGIDDYSGDRVPEPAKSDRWPEGAEVVRAWPSLDGAVADVEAMREMLNGTFGFAADGSVTTLQNEQATRAGIREALEVLTRDSDAGDQVLFFYSGHGSQVKSATRAEGDGRDETIVPADSRRGAADIRDKELRRWLNRLLDKNVELVVIQDSCHSGSGVRGDPGWRSPRAVASVRVPRLDAIEAGPLLVDRGAVVISATREDQLAHERCVDGTCFGAFTRALLWSMSLAREKESVADILSRTRARLRLYEQIQDPVLLGAPEVLQRSLFGGRQDHVDGEIRVAIERVRADGKLVLQGGWVNGLTEGSELRLPGTRRQFARVVKLDGAARAVAEVVPSVANVRAIQPGTATRREPEIPIFESGEFLSLAAWAPPSGESLRVWVPQPDGAREAFGLAAVLEKQALDGAFGWVNDPALARPTHVLNRGAEGWVLEQPDGSSVNLGTDPDAEEVASELDQLSRLYMRLPPPAALSLALCRLWETMPDSVERVDAPERASYLLVGRVAGGQASYAWLHRSALGANAAKSDLPLVSEWVSLPRRPTGKRGTTPWRELTARGLAKSAQTLARIHGWLTLESRQSEPSFPYRMAMAESARLPALDPEAERDDITASPEISPEFLLTGGELTGDTAYEVILSGDERDLRGSARRHVYVFTVDPHGKSQLLYPEDSLEDNQFPKQTGGRKQPAGWVRLKRTNFSIVPPYGRDVYYLFTSSEKIHDLGVFIWDGVGSNTRGAPTNALERLIANTASGVRGTGSAVPEEWSIERLVFDTKE